MSDYYPAVSFGPVGIAVAENGTLLLVLDNTSEEPNYKIEDAMARAENAALKMGYVRESIKPTENTLLFSSWTLVKAEQWAS